MAEEINGYKLVKMVGNGANSQVYEVVQLTSHRHFAMKILNKEKAHDRKLREMLFHEAAVGIEMTHQNVIKILDVDKSRDKPHFVMEFFPAGSLKQRMMRKETDFLKKNLVGILKQAATGLAYMNASGWVHRDVKPDNFLVNASAELRIIDFALAQRVRADSFLGRLFHRKGNAQGTPSYIAPEQLLRQPLDGRADIYAFGCTAYELVCNRPPFRGSSPGELLQKQMHEKAATPQMYNPDVTDEFAKLVLHMLEKKRENRPASFHEVLMALKNIRIYKSDPPRASAS